MTPEISNQDYAIALLMAARDALGSGYIGKAKLSIDTALMLLPVSDEQAIDDAVLKLISSE